jgi:hypothetical protein
MSRENPRPDERGEGLNVAGLVALKGPKLNPALVRYIREHAGEG